MCETNGSTKKPFIDFDPILPDSGTLFYEECPPEYEIQRPILLALKSSTQVRYEQLQHQAVREWKERKTTAKTSKN